MNSEETIRSLYLSKPNPIIVQEEDKAEGEDPDIFYSAINVKEKETDGPSTTWHALWDVYAIFQVIQRSAYQLTGKFLPCGVVG